MKTGDETSRRFTIAALMSWGTLLAASFGTAGTMPAKQIPTLLSETYSPVNRPEIERTEIVLIDFLDAMNGWVLTTDHPNRAGEVLRTRDGGRHFERSTSFDVEFGYFAAKYWEAGIEHPRVSQMRFANASDGWMFAPDLFSTHDGGKTWAPERRVFGALVPTEGAVWAIERRGTQNVVVRSRDSGRTWVSTVGQPLLSESLQLAVLDENHAWIATETEDLTVESRQIFGTSDGGRHWTKLQMPNADYLVSALSVTSDATLWLAFGSEPSTIMQDKGVYTSANGGSSWTLRARTVLSPGAGALNPTGSLPICGHMIWARDFSAVSRTRAFLSLSRGTLYRSIDAGRTWKSVIPIERVEDDLGSILSMKFVGTRHGWLSARRGGLLRSRDAGKTWRKLWLPPPAQPLEFYPWSPRYPDH